MDRRSFINKGCVFCLAATGISSFMSILESCKTASVYKASIHDSVITIPLSETDGKNSLIVRPDKSEYDIALIKNSDNTFSAFLMCCTHAQNPVTYNGAQFNCNLHGSEFDSSGNVLKGPAEIPLKKLNCSIINNSIEIKI